MPKTSLFVLGLVLAALAGIAAAQEDQGVMTAHEFTSEKHGKLPYRLFTPAGKEPRPLVLFLHGAGERGVDNEAQLRHGVRQFTTAAAQRAHPCFVAAPQCPKGVWWNIDLLEELLDALVARPGVDRDRVYVTGLSMGGFGTWALAARRASLIAAALPVCGGGDADTVAALARLPIWAFHGDADRTVPPDRSRTLVEALRKRGSNVQYTEYAGVGHDSWTRTYADRAVHEWLFAQRRAPRIELRDGDRVAFFGDSITEAGAQGMGYIRQLEALLQAREGAPKVELIGAGISGNRVPDLLARLEKDVLAKQPTVVVVYIGINDVWHSQSGRGTPREAYEAGLRELCAKLGASGARVLLCTPSVIGEKKENSLDPMLDDYAAISRQVAAEARVAMLDLRARFRSHLAEHNPSDGSRGVLTTDGVHLNEAGNRFVAEAILDALLPAR